MVQAEDAAGNASTDGPSTEVTTLADTTDPSFPAESSLSGSDVTATSVTLGWSAAGDDVGVSQYVIFQDGSQVGTVAGDVLTFDVTGLTPETSFTFLVQAEDAAGNTSTTSARKLQRASMPAPGRTSVPSNGLRELLQTATRVCHISVGQSSIACEKTRGFKICCSA